MSEKILIVEDEIRIRKLLHDYFKREGYEILEASDGQLALNIFKSNPDVSLIILDIMIPKLDGFSVCKSLREISEVPIIMLTAKSEESDKLLGFDLGADEYVTKPFSPKVLVARSKALLKRATASKNTSLSDLYELDGLRVNFLSKEVFIDDEKASLSPTEFELLDFMIKNKNIALTRDTLLDNVWGYDYFGDFRTVDTHIKRLRIKLKEKAKYIKTVRGSGYMFQESGD